MRRAAVALLLAGLLAACSEDSPSPVRLAWNEAALPAAGAIMLRDAAWCGDSWFVVGALKDDSGGTRPAAWTGGGGAAWSSQTMRPKTFYGEQNVLSAVACRGGVGAAVGAKSGGMHGNPRTSSWRWDGTAWIEVPGEFELFGGNDAVNVGRVAAGPRGFLISGNRTSGAAVWRSPDAAGFTLMQGVPGLASDAAGSTWAYDGVAAPEGLGFSAPAGGWLVVGAIRPKGWAEREALGWRSADGKTWSRVASSGPGEMQRIAVRSGVPIGAGVSGSAFEAWRLDGDAWRPVGSFGAVRKAGVAAVASLTVVGNRWFAMVSDGVGYGMWLSDDDGQRWAPAALPAQWAAAPQTTVAVSGGPSGLLLISDDGNRPRAFTAPV